MTEGAGLPRVGDRVRGTVGVRDTARVRIRVRVRAPPHGGRPCVEGGHREHRANRLA